MRVEKGWQRTLARILLGITGVAWFVWLGIEDRGTTTVLLSAALITFTTAVEIARRHKDRLPQSGAARVVGLLIFGSLCGVLVTPIAIVLMAVKTSLHSHPVPDFTLHDLSGVLFRTPAWLLGGLLLAAAGALYERLRS